MLVSEGFGSMGGDRRGCGAVETFGFEDDEADCCGEGEHEGVEDDGEWRQGMFSYFVGFKAQAGGDQFKNAGRQ